MFANRIHIFVMALFFITAPCLVGAANWKPLPDTGQNKCYDVSGAEIACPATGQPLHGQDAQYHGRLASYTDNSNGTVTDNNTGLIWQKADDGVQRDWQGASDYCSQLSLGGHSDWRLPLPIELESIIAYHGSVPAIDTSVFQGKSDYYWASTTVPFNNYKWQADFGTAGSARTGWMGHTGSAYSRCVRGTSTLMGPYTNNGDKTVSDKATGLIWQQGTADTNGDGSISNSDMVNWQEALAYCEGLTFADHSDWRLPNIREMFSLGDRSTYRPAVNPVFQTVIDGYYWSSTNAESAYYAKAYDSNGGSSGLWVGKSEDRYVRCTRAGLKQQANIVPILSSLLLSGKLSGIFIDSRVEGVKYKTSSGDTGTTGENGEFKYHPGDTVEFFVGNLSLGSVEAEELISVLEMENFSQVAMLLQALDDDHNPTDGIKITFNDHETFQSPPFTLQEVDPDDKDFRSNFKQVTGKSFELVEYNSVQHSYSDIRIEALKETSYNDIYKYYTGDLSFNDVYNKNKLENDVSSRMRLYFWLYFIRPYYEFCGREIWNDIANSLDSHETHKKGIEYVANVGSAINIVSANPSSVLNGFKDGVKELAINQSIDFITYDILPSNGAVGNFVKEFLNRTLKLVVPCAQAFYGDKQETVSCMMEGEKQILGIINDVGTSIALEQNPDMLESYNIAMEWLSAWYWNAGDLQYIADKFGMSKYSIDGLLDKIREEEVGVHPNYDKELTLSLITDALGKINILTEKFFSGTHLPRDLSVPGSILDFDFLEPKLLGNKLVFCYQTTNKINDTLSTVTTFNITPTVLAYTPENISRTEYIFLDPLASHKGCAILSVDNIIQGQKLEDYINLSLQVKYGKLIDISQVDEIDVKNITYHFSQDILEFLKSTADLMVSVSTPVTASSGDNCPLSIRHDLPVSGGVTYEWKQILTKKAFDTVAIVNSNSAQAEFVVPELPYGSTQKSLWFAVTVTSDSGEDVQKVVRVIVKPDASAPAFAPANLSASAEGDDIIFNWDTVPDADYYTLYISTQSGITPDNYQTFEDYRKINRIYETNHEELSLESGTTYYAVVTSVKNFQESSASNEVSATVGGVLPRTVISPTGRVWMDRNLGASRVATSMTDTEAYGDLYQWGRLTDGHEKRTSSTTTTLSSTDVPGHGNFILVDSSTDDWRSPQNDNLWQGVNSVNNPCPTGFRLPTSTEFQSEINSWSSKGTSGAFASPLKLIPAGSRYDRFGTLLYVGGDGQYWTSTVEGSEARVMSIYDSGANVSFGNSRGNGFSVRCIQD